MHSITRTSTTSGCGCGCGYGCDDCAGPTGCGDPVGLERTRFFPRQLVGPDDLTQDQRYFREKHRRHNRMLHGWGIVCGACVVPGDGSQQVVVTQGYVLSPHGDEIVIDHDVTLDLSRQSPTGALTDPCGAVDPWCTDVHVDRRDRPAWLVVRSAEYDTQPVQVSACGCGCDDTDCEYSRTRDGFELRLLDELPHRPSGEPPTGAGGDSSYVAEPGAARGFAAAELAGALTCSGSGRAHCPPCPSSPWVVLARVTQSSSGEVEIIGDPHRRYVASFGAYSFRCQQTTKGPSGDVGRPSYAPVALVDTTDIDSAVPAAATVAARTGAGNWVVVPGTFTVTEGETLGELLAREGGRVLVDPGTGEEVRLDELYAAAGADPTTTITSVADALIPLEGKRLDVSGLRVVRSQLSELIDNTGVERL
ncbi:MAG: hypothetical protein ABW004_15505, partial [Aeromicrobium sp.]